MKTSMSPCAQPAGPFSGFGSTTLPNGLPARSRESCVVYHPLLQGFDLLGTCAPQGYEFRKPIRSSQSKRAWPRAFPVSPAVDDGAPALPAWQLEHVQGVSVLGMPDLR